MGLRLKKAEEEAGIPLPSTSVHYYGNLASTMTLVPVFPPRSPVIFLPPSPSAFFLTHYLPPGCCPLPGTCTGLTPLHLLEASPLSTALSAALGCSGLDDRPLPLPFAPPPPGSAALSTYSRCSSSGSVRMAGEATAAGSAKAAVPNADSEAQRHCSRGQQAGGSPSAAPTNTTPCSLATTRKATAPAAAPATRGGTISLIKRPLAPAAVAAAATAPGGSDQFSAAKPSKSRASLSHPAAAPTGYTSRSTTGVGSGSAPPAREPTGSTSRSATLVQQRSGPAPDSLRGRDQGLIREVHAPHAKPAAACLGPPPHTKPAAVLHPQREDDLESLRDRISPRAAGHHQGEKQRATRATPAVRGAEGTAVAAPHTGITMRQPGAADAQAAAASGLPVAGGRQRTTASPTKPQQHLQPRRAPPSGGVVGPAAAGGKPQVAGCGMMVRADGSSRGGWTGAPAAAPPALSSRGGWAGGSGEGGGGAGASAAATVFGQQVGAAAPPVSSRNRWF